MILIILASSIKLKMYQAADFSIEIIHLLKTDIHSNKNNKLKAKKVIFHKQNQRVIKEK
jgi:hypothetical protein